MTRPETICERVLAPKSARPFVDAPRSPPVVVPVLWGRHGSANSMGGSTRARRCRVRRACDDRRAATIHRFHRLVHSITDDHDITHVHTRHIGLTGPVAGGVCEGAT